MATSPLERLRRRLAAGEGVVAGVLSGTSADGIDVVLARTPALASAGRSLSGAPEVLAFRTLPFAPELAQRVRAVLDGGPCGLRESALLSRDLGRAFGAAARELADSTGVELDLVASHGQTVWHHDGAEPGGPATLQLGDGDFVAEAAGCAVASDFRQRDIAAGGEGAPLSALADGMLFAAVPRPAAILNLGGMANLTLLPSAGADGLLAFDTGPAGSLLDGLARRLLSKPFDEGGARALAGRPHAALLAQLLEHPFLRRPPPKSTGRDTFGEAWVDHVVELARALGVLAGETGAENLLATACSFVAQSVALGLQHAHRGTTWLVACGGGVHNRCLLDALAANVPFPLAIGADFGVDPDAREALVFALLGACCVLEVPLSSTSATGAAAGRVLGKLSPGCARA